MAWRVCCSGNCWAVLPVQQRWPACQDSLRAGPLSAPKFPTVHARCTPRAPTVLAPRCADRHLLHMPGPHGPAGLAAAWGALHLAHGSRLRRQPGGGGAGRAGKPPVPAPRRCSCCCVIASCCCTVPLARPPRSCCYKVLQLWPASRRHSLTGRHDSWQRRRGDEESQGHEPWMGCVAPQIMVIALTVTKASSPEPRTSCRRTRRLPCRRCSLPGCWGARPWSGATSG